MTDSGLNRIIEAIVRLETKMDTVISRLGENDARFQRIEDRLGKLEKADERMSGIGVALMIVVPAAVATIFRMLFP
jgi:hypothetical protein